VLLHASYTAESHWLAFPIDSGSGTCAPAGRVSELGGRYRGGRRLEADDPGSPSACPAISDQACAALNSAYETALTGRGGSAVCTGSTTCTCSTTSREQVIGTSATYSVVGDQISSLTSPEPPSSPRTALPCAASRRPPSPHRHRDHRGGRRRATTIMSDIVLQLRTPVGARILTLATLRGTSCGLRSVRHSGRGNEIGS
jgi:hypothetical protein